MAGFHVLVFCVHYGVLHRKSVMEMTKFKRKQSPLQKKFFPTKTNLSNKLTLTTDGAFRVSAYCPWSHLWKKTYIGNPIPNIKLSSCMLPGWLLNLRYLNYTLCHGMLHILPSTNNTSIISLPQPRDGNAPNSHFCFSPFLANFKTIHFGNPALRLFWIVHVWLILIKMRVMT